MSKEVKIFPADQLLSLKDKFPSLSSIPELHLHSILLIIEESTISYTSLYFNPMLQYQKMRTATFGSFFTKTKEDAQLLFSSMEELCKQNNFEYLLGPMNGSTWESYRWNLPSKFPFFFSEEPNAGFLPELALQRQFQVVGEYESRRQDLSIPRTRRYPLPNPEIRFRTIQLENFEQELELISELVLNGFKNNFLYTEISKEHFKEKYRKLQRYMKSEFIWLAELPNQQLAGLMFAFPDYLNDKNETLVLKTIVRLPGRKYAGLIHQMQELLFQQSRQSGIRYWIHAFMWKQNASKSLSEKFNGERIREYVLLGKSINRNFPI